MESLFLVVPSSVAAPERLQEVRRCLVEHNAQLDAEGFVSFQELQLSQAMQSALYGGAAHWAFAPSSEVLPHPLSENSVESAVFCAAAEDIKSLFYSHFGDLWDAAVAEKRLCTAYDVMQRDRVTAADLEAQCMAAAAEDTLMLPAHLTITKLTFANPKGKTTQYVANAAYPAQHERLFGSAVGDGGAFWWCSASIHGSATQQHAEESEKALESLRSAARALQLLLPSSSGARVVANPLEALAFRASWMGVPLARDAFAAAVLRQSVPQDCLVALLRDPVLHDHGQFSSVFSLVRDAGVADAVDAIVDVWALLRRGEGDYLNGGAALYDYERGHIPLNLHDSPSTVARASAVVFAHPRLSANGETARLSLQQQLTQLQEGVTLDAVLRLSPEELQAKLDLHYGDVARYALDQEALRRFAVDEAADTVATVLTEFESVFGVSWSLALEEGRLWTGSLANTLLGHEQAQALLQHCASHMKETTRQLSSQLTVTKITREALIALSYPDTSLQAVLQHASLPSSASTVAADPSYSDTHQPPHALTPDSFFVVNADYGVYRDDVLRCSEAGGALHGEVWQVSWPEQQRIDVHAQLTAGLEGLVAEKETDESAPLDNENSLTPSNYDAAVGARVSGEFPLLHVLDEPADALRARHLWWGTPYDDDAVASEHLQARGESWLSLLPPLPPASQDVAEAVLVLPPRASTNHLIRLLRAALLENNVTVADDTDLYGAEAAEYVFGGRTFLAAAAALAHKAGASLWSSLSLAEQQRLTEVADGVRAAADVFITTLSADNLVGGATVCGELQMTLSAFEAAWHASQPRQVNRNCWLGFLPEHDVWVLNGHVPLLQRRYSAETARVHLMRLRWSLASVAWEDMHVILAGECGGVDSAAAVESAGLLASLLSRSVEKKSTEDADAAIATAEPLYLLSSSPYDSLIDVLRWPRKECRSGPLNCEVALEDWLLRQPYVRARLNGSVSCSLTTVVQQVRESLADPARFPQLADSYATAPQWISRFVRAQRDAQYHHGFIWLHPSSATRSVRNALPRLLLEHNVHVRASGAVPLPVAAQRQLLDVQHDGFYKNAYVRTAAQVPITDAEARAFAARFGQTWIAAVQLGLVLNAKEAEQRYGTVHVTTWWDSLDDAHQARLSDQLFIGHMASEGLYVMNPPYSYRRARLYAGGAEVVWYAVDWPVQDMTWEAYMTKVIGSADPARAAPGSLRHHFAAQWTQYSLPGKPDQIECVLHASDSPLAALAERTRWLSTLPLEHDTYGSALLQLGVHPGLLSQLLSNPSIYKCDTGIITEAFATLRQENAHELVAQLREYACLAKVLLIPNATQLIPPPAVPATPKHDGTAESHDERPSSHCGPSLAEQLQAYRDTALQSALSPFHLSKYAAAFAPKPFVHNGDSGSCTAVLYLDPLDAPTGSGSAVHRFVAQHLRHHGIEVVYERTVQCASEAEALVLFRRHHSGLYRYGVETPAAEMFANNVEFQAKFTQHYELSSQSATVVLRNAAEMADALHASGREVAALWDRARRLYPRDTLTLAPDCVVQRLQPRKPFFLVNGTALAAEQIFAANQAVSGVHVWQLQWDSRGHDNLSYQHVSRLVEQLCGPRGAFRECWTSCGWGTHEVPASAAAVAAVDDACPLLHVSEGSLAAVRHRQLWCGLPRCTDPTVQCWLKSAPSTLPPRALSLALSDPLLPSQNGADPRFLFDEVKGLDATRTSSYLLAWWASSSALAAAAARDGSGDGPNDASPSTSASSSLSPRNTAVIALLPSVATNSAVRQIVRSVVAEHGLRIDAYGFVASHDRDSTAQLRRTLCYLCPEDWSYATEEPHLIDLSPSEADRVAATFGLSWSSLVDGGRVLPASRATKRLGGMSAAQLQLFVKGAKKALWVRPHLHLVELEEYGVYVVNAHVAHLANAVADTAARQPLPYYVVSWDSRQMTWAECAACVVGAAEPSLASLRSIRGRVNASWSSLGLRAAPEVGEGVVCMSGGPVHGLLARLHLSWPAMDALDEDVVGGLALQECGADVVPLLRGWLANPVVTCDGRANSLLGHLAEWETDEVLHLLDRLARESSASPSSSQRVQLPQNLFEVRQEERDAEGKRAAEAAWESAVQHRDSLPVLPSAAEPLPAAGVVGKNDLLHRNVGTLLFLKSNLDAAQQALLREHLRQHDITVSVVAEEEEQEATPELLDRLRSTESHFANCVDLAGALAESNEVAAVDQERFNVVFRQGVRWEELLRQSQQQAADIASPRLYSAADAVRQWGWTSADLWQAVRSGVTMQLSEGMEVTQLVEETGENGVPLDAPSSCEARCPWAGSYVVNGAHVALRECLRHVPHAAAESEKAADAADDGAALEVFALWEVSWDSRLLSWSDFVCRVIGCADTARAVPGSFNASLHLIHSNPDDQELNSSAVSPLSAFGVVPSSGPVAAFAMRSRWCRNARNRFNRYVPDPLVRAMAMAGVVVPESQLDAWVFNPLVVVHRNDGDGEETGESVQRRLFDWTRGCNTSLAIESLCMLEAIGKEAVASAASASRTGTQKDKAVQDGTANGDVASGAVSAAAPPPPPPRLKKNLQAARVQDALLHARTETDWRRLWDYYTNLESSSAAAAPLAADAPQTISFATFYRDFKSLDTFGVPNMSHELKLLFVNVEVQGRGRMTYPQFTHALSLYHAL